MIRLFVFLSFAITMLMQSSAVGDETIGESFDRDVAPLLARRCLDCHNATTKKGGLDLSRAAGALAGGESGLAILPGKPDDSLLWERIAANEMPPKNALPADEKALLRQWIADGGRWGTDPIDPFRFTTDNRAGYDCWSLQPVARPGVPEVRNAAWPRNEIDRFVQAELEAAGLEPARQADPHTLIRRLYFDLIGLPPTPEEVEIWTNRLNSDSSNGAVYRELVDQLLDSPHYGERWARHWLDVIRFGESQGFERNRIRENAWRYRDWVIQAFNRDLPYDEFVRQQIAGDVLYPGDLDALLATGYLVCGTWDQVGHNEGSAEMRKAVRQDDLEDMVGALGQSFLGLTINCARCHDHKFDPISQREYYQAAALLGGVTQEEKERQGLSAKPITEEHREWAKSRDARRGELAALEQSLREQFGKAGGGNPIDGLQVLYLPGEAEGKILADRSGVGSPLDLVAGGKPPFASAAPATKLITAAKAVHELTIEAWLTPAKTDQSGPARIVTLSLDSGQRNFTLGQDGSRFDLRFRTTKTDQNGMPSLASPDGQAAARKTHVVYTFDRAADLRCFVDGKPVASRRFGGDLSNWNDSFRLALGDELSGDRRWEGQMHFVAIYDKALSPEQIARNFETESRDMRAGESLDALLAKASADQRSQFAKLRSDLQRLDQTEPAQPFDGVAHVIIPKQPSVYHVLARGDYRNPREAVSPGGFQSLSRGGLSVDFGLKADSPEAERRAALAKSLSDPRNSLTPRVLVNRLWHYHFGRGIVDTPSDFGFAGGRPSHPELLDWLAAQFVAGGWKIKDMQRLIVSSATYRQASNVRNARGQEIDADNRLLWRANSLRLDGEATRDAMLAASGALNRKLGGPSYRDVTVKLSTNHEFTDPTGEFNADVNRRTIYRLWARCGNNPLLESLDCPDPSVMSPQRSQTITPVQSLSLLNSHFVEQCSARLAERARREAGTEIEPQIDRAYRVALGRSPDPRELQLARGFVQKRGVEQLCHVLFNTNEFLFVE
ncbi:MAG: DUF1553 domain-containing protein [Pirellulaceae bacterium]